MIEKHKKRLQRARSLARREGCDALWVNDIANVKYLSGFSGSAGYVLLGARRGYFVTDSRYELQAAEQVRELEIVILRGRLSPLLKELARGISARRIGFSGEHVSFAEVQAMRKALRGVANLAPLQGSLSALRAVKDAGEIASIERAVRTSEKALSAVAGLMSPGVPENRIAEALACELLQGACDESAFDIIVACGPRSALPHATPSSRRLGKRDLLLVDWGARCGGYHSDETRVFYVGEPRKELKEIHRVVLEARGAALDTIRPNVAAAEVDKAARSVIEAAGYGEYFGHALGHGVGLEVHESPSLSGMSRDTLVPGMVFTVEPGIYLPGVGGVRIEDVIHLEGDTPRVMGRMGRSGALPRVARSAKRLVLK